MPKQIFFLEFYHWKTSIFLIKFTFHLKIPLFFLVIFTSPNAPYFVNWGHTPVSVLCLPATNTRQYVFYKFGNFARGGTGTGSSSQSGQNPPLWYSSSCRYCISTWESTNSLLIISDICQSKTYYLLVINNAVTALSIWESTNSLLIISDICHGKNISSACN